MDLKNVRFTEKRVKSGKKLVEKHDFNTLNKIILGNKICSEITISFFNRNKDNTEPLILEEQRLCDEFERYCLFISVSNEEKKQFEELRKILLRIYQFSEEEYSHFRSDFTEYLAAVFITAKKKKSLGLNWKASLFFHEPYIFYKRKRQLPESVFDIVHINRLAKVLDFYECKVNVNTFLRHLNSKKITKKTENAQRKIKYMNNVYYYFLYLKGCELDVCFFTFTKTVSNTSLVPSNISIVKGNDIVNVLANYDK
ncbi:TPA: hypothetical protein ACJI8N_001312 [Enterococcus hirae]